MAFRLSKQEIVKEIVKCGKDPQFFIDNYCRISHPLKGLIPFKTFNYQKDLLKDFNDYRFNIILKARQLGISTISAGYIVWFMLFHRDKNILVIATKNCCQLGEESEVYHEASTRLDEDSKDCYG
jgi:hypothetical protein